MANIEIDSPWDIINDIVSERTQELIDNYKQSNFTEGEMETSSVFVSDDSNVRWMKWGSSVWGGLDVVGE